MLITLVSSLGMSFGLSQLLAPLKRIWILLGAIVVNIVLGPLIAIGVCHLLPISDETRVGIEIVTVAALLFRVRIPLAVGMVIRSRYSEHASVWQGASSGSPTSPCTSRSQRGSR